MGTLHHLSVGCADCSVIAGKTHTFLVDCHGIDTYAYLLPADKKLRGVFITHQHYDHFDGLGYLKDNGYVIDFLIYSPYVRRRDDASIQLAEWNDFGKYRDYFVGQGTELRSPWRQDCFEKAWWEAGDVQFWILGPATDVGNTTTRELHDASLVVYVKLGTRRCLFTGDASDPSLKWVADHTKNICGDILHASHHGSINGADLDFVKECAATFTVISTEAGVHENVPHTTALKRYEEHTGHTVYRTDKSGSLKWSF